MERDFTLELKSIAADGTFEGFASTYGNVDEVGDEILPGAFTKTLSASRERPLLWQHRDPIGLVTLSDSPSGLIAKGKLSLDLQQAKDAYVLLKDRVVRAMSIGFQNLKSSYRGDIRQISEAKLYEISLVTMPANQQAIVTSVKSLDNNKQIQDAVTKFGREFLRVLKEDKSQWK